MDQFWLTDEPFARIAPHRPADMQGKGRVDDRRAIGGIGHARESGDRGTDGPRDVYGPKKTLYIETLTQAGGPLFQVPIDSTAVKAHRCGAGGEGGSKAKPSVARAAGA
jgi:hypothetical protein